MSAIVSALAAPLRALLEAFGTGDLSAGGVDKAIAAIEAQLVQVSAQTRSTNVAVGEAWTGKDSGSAQRTIGTGGISAGALATHTGSLRESVTVAAETVRAGQTELRSILDSFEQKASAANPDSLNPAALIAVLTLAADHLQQALDVLRRIRGELDGESGKVAQLAASTPAAPGEVGGGAATTPASTAASTVPAATSVGGAGTGSSGGGTPASAIPTSFGSSGSSGARTGGTGALRGGRTTSASRTASTSGQRGRTATVEPDGKGGYDIRLPDGSTVKAPNAQAAAAVQAALTQIGVPYSWGGTSPGVGLDCSGLTQWAYRQGGIEIPRIAADQGIGAQVSSSALQPGDLAVWDGHVAMVVGNGMMIEAGDPVQLSSIRTDNSGQGFHGFFRPTA